MDIVKSWATEQEESQLEQLRLQKIVWTLPLESEAEPHGMDPC